jgi:hypothetical protein
MLGAIRKNSNPQSGQSGLHLGAKQVHNRFRGMGLPNHPVTLTPEQIAELNGKLADLRHNVNNYLALIIAATELIRRRPETAPRLVASLDDPPQRITAEVKGFSDQLEKALEITRP